jgi:hypothetical protein
VVPSSDECRTNNIERYLVTREGKILRKMYGPTYENNSRRVNLLIHLNIQILLL